MTDRDGIWVRRHVHVHVFFALPNRVEQLFWRIGIPGRRRADEVEPVVTR